MVFDGLSSFKCEKSVEAVAESLLQNKRVLFVSESSFENIIDDLLECCDDVNLTNLKHLKITSIEDVLKEPNMFDDVITIIEGTEEQVKDALKKSEIHCVLLEVYIFLK